MLLGESSEMKQVKCGHTIAQGLGNSLATKGTLSRDSGRLLQSRVVHGGKPDLHTAHHH